MAILGMDGFDHYSDTCVTELNSVEGYQVFDSPWYTTSTGTRFNSGKCLQIVDDTNILYIDCICTNTILVSFAFKVTMSGDNRFLTIHNDVDLCSIHIYGNVIRAQLGLNGTVLETGTISLSSDTWYWFEAKIYVDNSAGNITVNIDGVEHINFTGDTSNSASTNITKFSLQSNNALSTYIDDLVWQDDTTTPDFLGDSRIETFSPTGDDTVTWDNSVDAGPPNTVTNASTIDEIPVDDADYVYTATADEEDLYDFNTISNDDTVHAISLKYRAQKSDTGARSIQSRTSETIAGDDFQGGTERALSTNWIWYSDVFETTDDGDPDAGTAWSQTLIGDATFGIKVTA